jgi:putative glutamine amidotransferase
MAQKDIYVRNACTPLFTEIAQYADGLIFTGGADIPPALYGAKTKLNTAIRTPRRHYWEISLLAHLLGSTRAKGIEPLLKKRPHLPVLGICLGMQTINVATGGTLYQDILRDIYKVTTFEDARALPSEQLHRSVRYQLEPGKGIYMGVYHPIRFLKTTSWRRLVPDSHPVRVLSIHHQALHKLGQGLRVTATSTDGKVIEAIEHDTFANVWGIQFHPDYYFSDRAASARGKSPRWAKPVDDQRTLTFHRGIWQAFSKSVRAAAK